MQYRHRNHETLLKEAENEAEKYKQWYKELEQPFIKQKEELHRLKLEVIKYEQKYNFIDLDKVMDEIAQYKTQSAEAIERS